MFHFHHLDPRTRKLMADEVARDMAAGTLYYGQRLSAQGRQDWPQLLQDAIARGDEDSLAASLRRGNRLNTTEQRRTPSGGTTTAGVPVTAAETLADGEFNRFYIRAVCRRALEDGIPIVIVSRAKPAMNARSASEAKIGTRLHADALLNGLRTNPGVDTALGLPAGPNSGLSVELP